MNRTGLQRIAASELSNPEQRARAQEILASALAQPMNLLQSEEERLQDLMTRPDYDYTALRARLEKLHTAVHAYAETRFPEVHGNAEIDEVRWAQQKREMNVSNLVIDIKKAMEIGKDYPLALLDVYHGAYPERVQQ